MVRNWQAVEDDALGLKGLTSLLDELGFKMMTLQAHHLRTERKVQLFGRGLETTETSGRSLALVQPHGAVLLHPQVVQCTDRGSLH